MSEIFTTKDYLRGSDLRMESTWYSVKNGKKIPLMIVAIYGGGSKDQFRIAHYEFEHMRTGKRFDVPWLQAVEMLENGTLIPNYDDY